MSNTQCLARLELIPGELEVAVFEHSIDTGSSTVSCWTFISRGLAHHQQKEIVLTLEKCADTPHPPQDPIRFFMVVHTLAARGQLVDVGDATEFASDDSLLGRPAVLYMPAQKFDGIDFPDPALAALLLPREELDIAREFGPMQLVTRLAQAYGFYPFPPWSDICRGPISFDAMDRTQRLPDRATGVWQRYEPERKAVAHPLDGPAELKHVVLLTPGRELEERISTEELSGFMKLTTKAIQGFFGSLPHGPTTELSAEFRIQPGGAVGVRLTARPGLPDATLRALRARLLQMTGPAVRRNAVAYEMVLQVWSRPMVEA